MVCPKCGKKTVLDFSVCPSCGYDTTKAYEAAKAEHSSAIPALKESSPENTFVRSYGTGAIVTLKFFAWLDLVAGIIGAIWIWSTFGSQEVTFGSKEIGVIYSQTVTNPVGVALGFVVLLQGIFVCAYFLVVASIAENLIEIRKNIESSRT